MRSDFARSSVNEEEQFDPDDILFRKERNNAAEITSNWKRNNKRGSKRHAVSIDVLFKWSLYILS